MNLKLAIPEPASHYSAQDMSAENSGKNSPFDYDRTMAKSTPSTSASSSHEFKKSSGSSMFSVQTNELTNTGPYPSDSNHKRNLSAALAEFRNDVEEHRNHEPKINTRTAPHVLKPFVPATSNLLSSFKNTKSASAESFHLDSQRLSNETAETSTEDYEQFLHESTLAKPGARAQKNPHLSTISSIISKPSRQYSDDEDDEIDEELERQLQELKTGSEVSLASKSVLNSEDSFVTANAESVSSRPVPSFKISAGSMHSVSSSDTEDDSSENLRRRSECELTPPLANPQYGNEIDLNEPVTPYIKQTEQASVCETPETIKPLSPKNHFVQKELEEMNFRYAPKEQPVEGLNSAEDTEDGILLKHPVPVEFEAFPKSIIDPNFPTFRDSNMSQKHQPGQGPCRGCNKTVQAESRGSEKAIFSKNGDLTGQWHRRCFKCSYAGCSIAFNKTVTPYVLLDNAFCNHHYHILNDTLCQTCHFGIEGECIENELQQKWHPGCLTCTACQQRIGNDYFLIEGKIFCDADASNAIDALKKAGMLTEDKVEKRRTRMLFIE